MAPFEALYGRRCRTPLNWSESRERLFFGLDMVNQAKESLNYTSQYESGIVSSKKVMQIRDVNL
jgi:hypothetical protein